jgi:hypothetical protein
MTPLVVDSEGSDRSSDCSVDIDHSERDACIGLQPRHPVEKRAAIGLILGCEGGHSDRLRIRLLLIDRVEIPVLERSQRDVHLGDPKGVAAWAVPGSRLREYFGNLPERESYGQRLQLGACQSLVVPSFASSMYASGFPVRSLRTAREAVTTLPEAPSNLEVTSSRHGSPLAN